MSPDLTYDADADALYIRLSQVHPYEAEDAGPLTLHYDREGRVVALEVLQASLALAPGAWSQIRAKPAMEAAE